MPSPACWWKPRIGNENGRPSAFTATSSRRHGSLCTMPSGTDSCRNRTDTRASLRFAVPTAGEHALGTRVIAGGTGTTRRLRVSDVHLRQIMVVSAVVSARIGESIHHRGVELGLPGIEAQAPKQSPRDEREE